MFICSNTASDPFSSLLFLFNSFDPSLVVLVDHVLFFVRSQSGAGLIDLLAGAPFSGSLALQLSGQTGNKPLCLSATALPPHGTHAIILQLGGGIPPPPPQQFSTLGAKVPRRARLAALLSLDTHSPIRSPKISCLGLGLEEQGRSPQGISGPLLSLAIPPLAFPLPPFFSLLLSF